MLTVAKAARDLFSRPKKNSVVNPVPLLFIFYAWLCVWDLVKAASLVGHRGQLLWVFTALQPVDASFTDTILAYSSKDS